MFDGSTIGLLQTQPLRSRLGWTNRAELHGGFRGPTHKSFVSSGLTVFFQSTTTRMGLNHEQERAKESGLKKSKKPGNRRVTDPDQ